MNTGDWIDAALHLVQIAAIVIGALWAYYKFFRGRIFHERAEPSVEASLRALQPSPRRSGRRRLRGSRRRW
jgi:hypothetical protein